MGKGRKSGASSSKKIIEVDEDQVLEVIENKEFLTMRAATSAWPVPTTTEEQLRELANEGLIQDQGLAKWRAPGEHRVPSLNPGEIVLFVSFVCAGLCLLASPFLHRFLRFFDVTLNHLTSNGVLHLSVFVHFCEAFLGILPSIRQYFCPGWVWDLVPLEQAKGGL
jgi:hypothetical protein